MPGKRLDARTLWAIPRVGAPVPSPDGVRVLVPVTTYDLGENRGATRLWVVPANGREEARPVTTADASSGSPAFSPDGRRILFTRKPVGEDEAPAQLWLMDLAGGEPERITDLPFGAADPRWFPDGRTVAFVSDVYRDAPALEQTAKEKERREADKVDVHVTEDRFYRFWDRWLTDGRVRHFFAMDLKARVPVDLTPAFHHPLGLMEASDLYRIAPDGREIAFSAVKSDPPYDDITSGVFTVRLPARIRPGMKVPAVVEITADYDRSARYPVYSPDGRYLVYGIQREKHFYGDRVRLVACDRRTGRKKVLTESWDRSAGVWTFGEDPRTLWLIAEDRGKTAVCTLDLTAARRAPRKNPPATVVRSGTLSGLAVAGGRVFVSRSTLREAPEVFVLDEGARRLRRLTRLTAPALRGVKLSTVKELWFPGAGGEKVQMFVLLPPGATWPKPGARFRKRPLVHMIHGGPHGVFGDQWHWRWNAQAFAAPGYVVALVNFHGSSSFGQAFTQSILGEWGEKPYEDIERATDRLIELKLVDGRRMAVTGGSYGGYLVSWIATRTDRYRAIVNHAGVSDFQTQYASDITHGRPRSMGGEPWENIEGMDRFNPMRHAAGFSSPMLVIHGQRDYRVPYDQGLEIYNVLKAMGVPARLVVYPGENHWILKPANSLHWYKEVLSWLKRWLSR